MLLYTFSNGSNPWWKRGQPEIALKQDHLKTINTKLLFKVSQCFQINNALILKKTLNTRYLLKQIIIIKLYFKFQSYLLRKSFDLKQDKMWKGTILWSFQLCLFTYAYFQQVFSRFFPNINMPHLHYHQNCKYLRITQFRQSIQYKCQVIPVLPFYLNFVGHLRWRSDTILPLLESVSCKNQHSEVLVKLVLWFQRRRLLKH